MTIAVWIALFGAVGVLVGQWATGRLFVRLAAIEKHLGELETHLRATDAKVEAINEEGSRRSDVIQKMYGELLLKLTIIETINIEREKERLRQRKEVV